MAAVLADGETTAIEMLQAGTLGFTRVSASPVASYVPALNAIQLPEYDTIPWSIPADREQVGVIHTLCIHSACGGRGQSGCRGCG